MRLVSSAVVSAGSDRQYDVFSIGTPAPSGVVANLTRSIGRLQSRSRSATHCASAAFT